MLLGCNDGSCFLCRRKDYLTVDGLYGMDIDNSCRNAVFCQLFSRFHCHCYHKSCRNKGNVASVHDLNALAYLKFVIGSDVENGGSVSAEAEIYGAVKIDSRFNRRFCFDCICGIYNCHTGNGTHKSDVLKALMGSTVLADGNSSVRRTYLNSEMRIAHRVSYLLKSSSCRKHCKGGSKNTLACGGDTCGDGNHVALGNSAVEKSFGKFFLENSCFCSCRKVCVKHQKIVFFSKLGKCLTVSFSCCFLFVIHHSHDLL